MFCFKIRIRKNVYNHIVKIPLSNILLNYIDQTQFKEWVGVDIFSSKCLVDSIIAVQSRLMFPSFVTVITNLVPGTEACLIFNIN